MSSNSTFYFQSNRRRGRTSDSDERNGGSEVGARNVITRLATLQGDVTNLAAALQGVADGQALADRENEALRAELGALRETLLAGQEALQALTTLIAERFERRPGAPVADPNSPGQIIIEPIRPRLLYNDAEPEAPEAVLRLDGDR